MSLPSDQSRDSAYEHQLATLVQAFHADILAAARVNPRLAVHGAMRVTAAVCASVLVNTARREQRDITESELAAMATAFRDEVSNWLPHIPTPRSEVN